MKKTSPALTALARKCVLSGAGQDSLPNQHYVYIISQQSCQYGPCSFILNLGLSIVEDFCFKILDSGCYGNHSPIFIKSFLSAENDYVTTPPTTVTGKV